jgi:hypothetical protein
MKLINATELDRKSGERSGEISVWIPFPGDVSRQEIRSGRVAKGSALYPSLKENAVHHLPFAFRHSIQESQLDLPALRNSGCKWEPLIFN